MWTAICGVLKQESGDMKNKVYIEDIDGITAGHIEVMQTMMVGGHIACCHHNGARAYFVPSYHTHHVWTSNLS